MIKYMEYARERSRRRNDEHNFYKTALHCQMPQEIRSKMIHGFKVSQRMRSQHNRSKNANDDIGRDSAMRNASGLSGSSKNTFSLSGAKCMRYSLKQYEELINHMWRHSLDTEQKNEVSEAKFVRFLRENKILTEKKQLDEMFKQCVF